MDFMKRLFTYIIIILLIASIYHDLSLEKEKNQPSSHIMEELSEDYVIYKVKVDVGDTVLSIVEELNEPINKTIILDKVMDDFKSLNPEVDPYQLQVNQYYYFPVYTENGD